MTYIFIEVVMKKELLGVKPDNKLSIYLAQN